MFCPPCHTWRHSHLCCQLFRRDAATCKYLSEQPVTHVVRVARSFAAGFSIVLLEYGVVYPAGMPVMQAATDQNRCAGRLSKTVKLNPDLSNVIGKFRIRRSLFFTGRWRRIYITRPLVLARIRFQGGFRMARSSSFYRASRQAIRVGLWVRLIPNPNVERTDC